MESAKSSRKALFLIAISVTAICLCSRAASPPHGKEKLRELVVFPSVIFPSSVTMQFQSAPPLWWMTDGESKEDDISTLRQELKQDPENVPELMKLGYLLEQNGQTNESDTTFEFCKALCKSRLLSRPRDGVLLAELATALNNLGKWDESESIYRKGVQVASNQWQCWAGLACYLQNSTLDLMRPDSLRNKGHIELSYLANVSPELLDFHPSKEALQKCDALRKEADNCMERAMRFATNDSEAFIEHAGYNEVRDTLGCYLRYFRDRSPLNQALLNSVMLSHAMASDLRKAADLDPENVQLLTVAIFVEFGSGLAKGDPAKLDPVTIPESSESFVNEGMARLKSLAESGDKKKAARALQDLATLEAMRNGDHATVRELAGRAVKFDPANELAWDLWLGFSKKFASFDELVEMSEQRLKQKDCARNHLLLAKLFAENSKWDRAQAETETALTLEPQNITAHLMQGAIMLRQSTNQETLDAASAPFSRAKALIEQLPDSELKWERWREANLNSLIAFGLQPNEDGQKSARELIKQFIDNYPDDEDARKLREALE